MSGATITVVATEETELDYRKIHGDEPPLTAYTAEHVFTFERTGAGWTLTAHRAASTDGLAPVTEVSVETQSTGPNADPGAAGTTRPAGPLSPGDKPSESSGGAASKATATAIPAGLNYQAMVSYAVAHWGGAGAPYNPSYRDFSANGGGGDCTNFISQSLRNGGWLFKTGFYQDNNNWWYGLVTQTYTWAGAQNWSIFAPQRTTRLANVWDMRIADVLQYDSDHDGKKDHTMLVTKWTSSEIYMTFHTTNTLNKSLSSIIAAHAGVWWYAYGT